MPDDKIEKKIKIKNELSYSYEQQECCFVLE